MVEKRTIKYLAEIPANVGRIVAMIEYRGRIIVAMEQSILELVGDALVPIDLAPHEKRNATLEPEPDW